jgi:hypothetical protein
MILDGAWDEVSDETWKSFAKDWLAELALETDQTTEEDWRGRAVMMSFTASAGAQWKFILAAMDAARTPDERSHIAAGPVEYLLSKHGAEFIGFLEQLAADKADWAEMMRGVWRLGSSDDVWERVQAIQNREAE